MNKYTGEQHLFEKHCLLLSTFLVPFPPMHLAQNTHKAQETVMGMDLCKE